MALRYKLLLSCCALTMTAACAYARGFRLRKDGLQSRRHPPFRAYSLPSWKYGPGFDVVVRKPGAFRYRGKSEHDQYYLMTYRPKAGRAAAGDRGGRPVIVRPGDRIGMTGSTDAIYYCRLGGGIYDEPMLSSLLAVDDSLGRVRGRYLEAANPHGSLYLLIDRIPKLSYTPAKEAHRFYKTLSEGLKTSYFGRMYADCMARMEQLAEGKPAPDFTLTTTEDRTVAKADFKGRYLLLYHWGLCPGSIHIDRQVSDLFEKYKDKGLQVVGLTESIADIRSVYESLPAGKKNAVAGCGRHAPRAGRHAGTRMDRSGTGNRSSGKPADHGNVCHRRLAVLRSDRSGRHHTGTQLHECLLPGEKDSGQGTGRNSRRMNRETAGGGTAGASPGKPDRNIPS